MSGFKVFTNYRAWMDETQVFITHESFDQKRVVARPLQFVEFERFKPYDTPTIADGEGYSARDFLQACMDAAWDLGLRPKGFADQKNELQAVRYHLEDMRALAKVPSR